MQFKFTCTDRVLTVATATPADIATAANHALLYLQEWAAARIVVEHRGRFVFTVAAADLERIQRMG